MARIEVLAAEKLPAFAGYAAPTAQLRAGSATTRLHDPEDNPVWIVTGDLEPGAVVAWDTDHGDEAVYVMSGELRAGDRVCGAGGVLVVESGVRIEATATVATSVIHFGPSDPQPPSTGRNGAPEPDGHRAHAVGPKGVYVRVAPGHYTRFFAGATCPTCRISLMESCRTQHYQSAAHSHSQHELIHVLEGELKLGSLRVGPGDTLSVPANVRYRFETGESGYRFLNYSSDASAYIPANPEAKRQAPGGSRAAAGFVYTGDGGDYMTEAEFAAR
jgi:quercetin dioxygenase-like cupin family protein